MNFGFKIFGNREYCTPDNAEQLREAIQDAKLESGLLNPASPDDYKKILERYKRAKTGIAQIDAPCCVRTCDDQLPARRSAEEVSRARK